jgi:hypothetical protein
MLDLSTYATLEEAWGKPIIERPPQNPYTHPEVQRQVLASTTIAEDLTHGAVKKYIRDRYMAHGMSGILDLLDDTMRHEIQYVARTHAPESENLLFVLLVAFALLVALDAVSSSTTSSSSH